MRKVALITDGWRRLFTYAWPAGILQRIRETGEDVNLYIFNSTGNWSRDAGYNRAEYNIYNLPELSDFDGIILELNNISSPAVLADVISNAKRSGRPVVSIANELGDFYYVGIDNYSAMKQVIAHLHEVHDCKKFWLLVGAQDNYESSCRLQGMLDYAKEHKIKIDKDDIWYGSFDYKSGLEGYKHLWDRHKELPDAVICINDNVAVAVCEAAAQMGFHAPADFRITGFDNFDKAGFYTPSITTVGHIQEEAAYQGMDVLLRLWAGENVPKYNFTETEMLWQESCGCGKGSSRDARAHLKDQIMYSVESEEFDEEVLSMEAEMMKLLPLVKEDFMGKAPVDIYQEEIKADTTMQDILEHVVPNYVNGFIYGALVESFASEHNSRMMAMQAATDSAKEMLQTLSIEYNRVRQAAITQQITEVIGGAKAQKKKKKK